MEEANKKKKIKTQFSHYTLSLSLSLHESEKGNSNVLENEVERMSVCARFGEKRVRILAVASLFVQVSVRERKEGERGSLLMIN